MTGYINPKDPVPKTQDDKSRALFERMGQASNGFDCQTVVEASANVMINAFRTTHANRRQAEAAFDEWWGKAKTLLLQNYDSTSGKRLSIFPFTQHVMAAHHIDKDKGRG